jgi:hypothetical protein
MMRAPSLAAIHAAESRIAQSGRDARDGLRRARVAFRANLTRPSTLALVVGVAGLLSFWLARKPQPPATSSPAGVSVATTASVAGLAGAFIVRYAMKHLPFVLQQAWAVRQKHAARTGRELSKWPATGYSATGVRH